MVLGGGFEGEEWREICRAKEKSSARASDPRRRRRTAAGRTTGASTRRFTSEHAPLP
jgi:hypothetical protein